jgi:HSP20 family protein
MKTEHDKGECCRSNKAKPMGGEGQTTRSMIMDKQGYLPSLFGRGLRQGQDVFSQLQHEVDRVFDSFTSSRPLATLIGNGTFEPAIDVAETVDAIEMTAEIPGCDPKDVEITLVDRTLTLRGEKKTETEQKEKNYHAVERSYGAFVRTMTLPFATDPAKIVAKFDNGVLRVHLPKPPEAMQDVKKIPIQA